MPDASTEDQLRPLVEFARALRVEGISAGTGATAEFCRAAALLGPADLYWAGRATLVARREEIEIYDRVFRSFFGASVPTPRDRRSGSGSASSRPASTPRARKANGRRVTTVDRPREPHRAAPPQELRPLHAGGAGRAGGPRPGLRARAAAPPLAPSPRLRRRASRPAAYAPPLAPHRRRAVRPPLPRAPPRAAPARPAPRRLRLDGGALAGAAGPRALDAPAAAADRGLLLRNASHVDDARARRVQPGRGAPPRREGGRRLGGRHEDRRGAEGVPGRQRSPRRGPRRGGRHLLRRPRRRRARAPARPDGTAVAARLPDRLAESAEARPVYEPLARGMEAALPYVDVFASGHNLASLEAVALELAG